MSHPFFIQSGKHQGRLKDRHSFDPFDVGPETTTNGARGSSMGRTVPRNRFRVATAALFFCFSVFLARAVFLQIYRGPAYRLLAEQNRVRVQTLLAPRGIVTDRHGEVLAQNVPTFVFEMTPADLPTDAEERHTLLNRASELAGVTRTDLDLLLTKTADEPFEPAVVIKGMPYETAMRLAIEATSLPGFSLSSSTTRSYNSTAPSLSHVLGYMGSLSPEEYAERKASGYRVTDDIGKAGVERSAEVALRGVPGAINIEVDARGNERSVVSKRDPVAGTTIRLGIDLKLQVFIEQQVSAALERLDRKRASVVAIDPRSGVLRALVSLPAYDSNVFADGIEPDAYAALLNDPDRPLFPRAIAGEFPPGSTFKPYVAYAALAEELITPTTSFLSTGGLYVGGSTFPDWKVGGHGITDVRKAIAQSVNTFFYIIGGGYDTFGELGVERIVFYAKQFGFAAETGIDLPGEANGFLPSKDWKREVKGERWYVGDTYHLAIGQGDALVTPIQLATAVATIANGGKRYQPHVIEAMGDTLVSPMDLSLEAPFNAAALQTVREGMRQTVVSGSARSMNTLAYPVAGKTGTAQAPGGFTHAWFTGFGPYENPTLAVTVLIEEGGEGSSVAVPIARDIFEWWFRQGGAED
jgi:penicillin-binding protein 2